MELEGENGIFMKIVRKEAPAHIVYEDEDTLAFLSTGANAPGHTLVIPKQPYRNVFDVDETAWQAVMRTARKIAPMIRDAVGAKGVHINSNHEPEAGQEVFHLHVHIIPRESRESFDFCWPRLNPSEEERAAIANRIREQLS
ncbi:MAG TPA: HIT family protein [Candidatus Paceibacterota bacterium]